MPRTQTRDPLKPIYDHAAQTARTSGQGVAGSSGASSSTPGQPTPVPSTAGASSNGVTFSPNTPPLPASAAGVVTIPLNNELSRSAGSGAAGDPIRTVFQMMTEIDMTNDSSVSTS